MLSYKLSIFWDSCKGNRAFKLCCLFLLEEEEYQNHFIKIFAFEEIWTDKLSIYLQIEKRRKIVRETQWVFNNCI